MTTRTGDIGNCFEYNSEGRRLPGCDSQTIDGMVRTSAIWRDTWHQYVGPNGYECWARAGKEIQEPCFPAAA